MSQFIQLRVVNRFPDVLDRLLWVQWSDNLVLPGTDLVRSQYSNLPPGHLLFVDGHGLCDMVHLRFHLAQLLGLQVQQLQVVECQRVDLIRYTGQRLGSVVLGLLKGFLLVAQAAIKNGLVRKGYGIDRVN